MAKRASGGVNKSQAIRDALKENPGKPPRMIAELLKAKGLNVTPQYVSIVKSSNKGRGSKTVRVRKPGRPAGGARAAGSLGSLSAAIEFIRAAGGLQAAKRALQAVEEIKNLG